MLPILLSLANSFADPTTAAEETPWLRQTDLFISGQDSVSIYRIPSLLVAPSGAVLAFCEAREGDDGDPTDLVLKRSRCEDPPRPTMMFNGYPRTFGYGVTWDPLRVVLPGEGNATMNPCPVVNRASGDILLCTYRALGGLQSHLQRPFEGPLLLTTSKDEGVTWSPPRDLKPEVGDFIAGPGVGIQLRDGRIVIPGYSPVGPGGGTASRVIFSDDHGQSWHAGAMVDAATDESQVVELTEGVVMLNARSNRGRWCRYVATSGDGGQTRETQGDELALPETQCQASLVARDHAAPAGLEHWLLFSNPANPGPWAACTRLTVRLSCDLGATWVSAPVVKCAERRSESAQ